MQQPAPTQSSARLQQGPTHEAGGPSADEVADRFVWRSTHTTDDAPEFLGGEPGGGPPDPAILPPDVRRTERAMGAMLAALFAPSDREADETTVRGIPVHPGVYEGTARIIHNSSQFDRIRPNSELLWMIRATPS